jgi:raffinose/stachyose/melibiose transport system permease protein
MTKAPPANSSLFFKGGARHLLVYLFVLPAFIFHLIFILIPSMGTVYLSFFDWTGVGVPKFNGITNYKTMLSDPLFYNAMLNNLKWIAVFVTVPVILGLLVAYWISTARRSQMLMRTIYFIPYVVAAAMAGKIWSAYLNPYFGVSIVFRALGMEKLSSVLWLGNPDIALFTVMFVNNWHFWPFVMVLFLGALQQIDPALYESARVEGTSKWQEFIFITVPCIMPTFTFVIITIIMWSFLTFDYVWVMTGGGPGQATEIIATMVYKNGFQRYKVGYANSICVIQSVLSIAAYSVLQIMKKRGWDV